MNGRLRRLGRADALALTASLWFLGKFVRYAFPPLFETLAAEYHVSTATLGTAFTGFMLVYAAMQFPSGVLADRLGSVRVIAGGALLSAAAALSLTVDTPLPALVGAMLLMGAGTGTLKTVAVELLSRIYADRTGRALGVFDTFGSFGGAAAPAAVVAFVGSAGVLGAGWRTTFLLAGVAGIGVAAAFAVRVPRRLPDAGDDRTTRDGDGPTDGDGDRDDAGATLRTYVCLFRAPRFAAFVAVTVLFAFAYSGVVAFLPLYLIRRAGLPSATANLIFSLLFVVSLTQLVTGEVSDRVGTLPVLVGALGLATAGFAAVLVLTPTGSALALGAAVVCMGAGAHGYRPVRGVYLMAVLPESVAGGGLGAVRTLLMGAGALAPAVVGVLSETAGFRPAFLLLAGTLAGATLVAGALLVVERA
ncbi:MAG: MFS transporter [Haloarculaceae archaeon]